MAVDFKRVSKLILTTILCSCSAVCPAIAQLPVFSAQPNYFYSLITDPMSAINTSSHPSYSSPSWEPKKQHYTGNSLPYLSYPAIAKAGYKYMEVTKLDCYYSELSLADAAQVIDDLENVPVENGDKITTNTYSFDPQGWLRTISAIYLLPESEGYGTSLTSFDYERKASGGTDVKVTHDRQTSGRGYHSSDCKGLPAFAIGYYTTVTDVSWDAWGNVTDHSHTSSHRWDTCKIEGLTTYKWHADYNDQGRMVVFYDYNSRDGGKVNEYRYSYSPVSLTAFLNDNKFKAEYAYFSHPVMEQWLASFKKADLELMQLETRNYMRYNSVTRENKLNPDSPSVKTEHFFVLRDAQHKPVGQWQDRGDSNVNSSFNFYLGGTDSATNNQWSVQQSLPNILVVNKDNCAPLYDKKATLPVHQVKTSFADEQKLGNYILYHNSKDESNNSEARQTFDPKRKAGNGTTENTINMLADANGLAQYVWGKNYIYKIKYHN